MFILGVVIDVIENLTQFRYGHDLAIGHLMGGVGDQVGLVMELLFPIMRMYGYILLNEPGKLKDHVDPLQVYGKKHAGSTNCIVGGISHFEGQLMLVVCP